MVSNNSTTFETQVREFSRNWWNNAASQWSRMAEQFVDAQEQFINSFAKVEFKPVALPGFDARFETLINEMTEASRTSFVQGEQLLLNGFRRNVESLREMANTEIAGEPAEFNEQMGEFAKKFNKQVGEIVEQASKLGIAQAQTWQTLTTKMWNECFEAAAEKAPVAAKSTGRGRSSK